MQATGSKNKTFGSTILKHFPKAHVLLVAGLASGLAIVGALPSEDASAGRHSQRLALPEITETPLEKLEAVTAESGAPDPGAIHSGLKKVEEVVRSGDNLSKIFARVGVDRRDLHALVNSGEAGKQLARLYPGHKLIFHITRDSELHTLEHVKNRLNSQIFSRTEDGFVDSDAILEPDVHLAMRQATIENSLYMAGTKVQLDDRLIMDLATIFGWDIDFALDIRKGDNFKVLFEERFLDGEKIGNGDILAAEFTNQGRTFRAVRYVDSNGESHYYTPTGESMRKAFLRAPLDFRRISSNFNPRRLHPIHKTVRPHRGTDYVAARGTPVWASGSGRVISSGYTRANGNYVVIQHGNNIQTKYLHLHRRHVKTGDRVRQKQQIGTVGSTGYSTAPHLHYEFLLNGTHRNPRTIIRKLPKAESVAQEERSRFEAQIQPLLAELDDGQGTRFATAEQVDPNTTL